MTDILSHKKYIYTPFFRTDVIVNTSYPSARGAEARGPEFEASMAYRANARTFSGYSKNTFDNKTNVSHS